MYDPLWWIPHFIMTLICTGVGLLFFHAKLFKTAVALLYIGGIFLGQIIFLL